jgi:hypothetical protein
MEKYDIIVNAEQQFAREVTLGVIVARPLTMWHYIIPGFFIIDYLRRSSLIRQYTGHFMFPRRLAMDAAAAEIQGEDKDAQGSNLETEIKNWLQPLGLYSQDLVTAHIDLVEILAAYYFKLLKTDGETINEMIEQAYQTGDNFKQFVRTVTDAENEVDRQVIEQLGGDEKVKEKIAAEQEQIARRRQKILDQVF